MYPSRLIFCLLFLVTVATLPAESLVAQSSSPFYDLQNQPSENRSDTGDTRTDQSDTETTSTRDRDDADTQSDVEADTSVSPEEVTTEDEQVETDSADAPSGDEPSVADEEQEPEPTDSDTGDDTDESPTGTTEPSRPEEVARDTESPDETDTVLPLMDTDPMRFNVMTLREGRGTDAIDSFARSSRGTTATTGVVSAREDEQQGYTWLRGGSYGYGLLMGAITFGGIGIITLIYLARRPRVRVIETANRTANKYLNLNRTKREGGAVKRSEPAPGQTTDNREETGSSGDRTDVVHQSTPPWEWSDDRLQKEGIDPDYRPVLRMYFQEDLTVDQIADRTGRGSGEIGLALDLVDRSTTGA